DPALAAHGGTEGIASFVSECLPHRPHTRVTRRGKLHLGARGAPPFPAPSASEGVGALADLLKRTSLVRVTQVADILPYKYAKLMYNAAISPVAAAAGLDNGQLLSVPKARRLFFDLLRENHAILSGAGIALERIGPFHPTTVQRILSRRWAAN